MCAWSRAATSSCRKKFDDPRAYFFQNPDGRIIFAIPYEDDFTLIGTTDRDYTGNPADVAHQRRRDRLPLRGRERVFPRAGRNRTTSSGPIPAVRPLLRRRRQRRRRKRRATTCCSVEGDRAAAPLLNVFGGKLTTYRRLSESRAREDRRCRSASRVRTWTARRQPAGRRLPGQGLRRRSQQNCTSKYPFLAAGHARRLVRLYGTRASALHWSGSELKQTSATISAPISTRRK